MGGYKVETEVKILFIIVSISHVFLTSNIFNNSVNVEADKKHIFSCNTKPGRPAAWISWFFGTDDVTYRANLGVTEHDSKFTSNSSFVYTGKDGDHGKTVYCTARNILEGPNVTSDEKKLYITVPIAKVSLMPPNFGDSVTVISDEITIFKCRTDLSRPAAWILWFINEKNVTGQARIITNQTGTKYLSRSMLTYIGRIRDHNHVISCKAFNTDNVNVNVSDQTSLNVFSSPMSEGNQSLEGDVFVGTHEKLNLTIVVIANPAPKVNWTFANETDRSYAIIETEINITSTDTFRHVIKYEKENPSQSDYGNYTIKVSNGVGTMFVHTFIVKPAHRPDHVIEVKTVCHDMLDVLWRSESDGGSTQMFQVVLKNLLSDTITRSDNVTDPGKGSIVHFTMKNLLPQSYYTVKIESSNIYGTVQSDGLTYCNTSGTSFTAKKITESTRSFSTGFGSGAALIVCINIITIIAIFMWKKRRQTTKERSNVYEQTKHNAGNANMYNELGEISTAKQIYANTDDRTYEEISSEMRQSSSMNKRKQKGKIRTS